MVPSTLGPSTAPSWRNMLTDALGMPACSAGTLFTAAAVEGATSRALPAPATSRPGHSES